MKRRFAADHRRIPNLSGHQPGSGASVPRFRHSSLTGSRVEDNPVDPEASSEHIGCNEEAIMADEKMMAEKRGFVAALDQSGGSTPGVLRP